jgi:squalene cyclase
MIGNIVLYYPHKNQNKIHYHILKIHRSMQESQNIRNKNSNKKMKKWKIKIKNKYKMSNNLNKIIKPMV